MRKKVPVNKEEEFQALLRIYVLGNVYVYKSTYLYVIYITGAWSGPLTSI
jgi:hypothetical protein